MTKTDERNIIDLYRKNLSASEISGRIGFSLKQIYRVLQKNGVERRSAALCNRVRFQNSPLSFSFPEKLNRDQRELMIAAVMLYLGEGAKTGNTVDIANSDPGVLKVFLRFLRDVCHVDEKKFRFYLYCFSDQDVAGIQNFWIRSLHVRKESFTKPYIRQSSSQKSRIMRYGVLHVRYNDKRLLEKILFLCSSIVAQIA